MDTDTDFRDILRNEGRFAPSNALIDKLLMYSEEIRLKPGGVLIGYVRALSCALLSLCI